MSRPALTLALLSVLLGAAIGAPVAALGGPVTTPTNRTVLPGAATGDHPMLAALYPNPHATGDAGEFVALDVLPWTDLTSYRVCDGERCVALPNRTTRTNRTTGSRVVLTATPERVRKRNLTDGPVYGLPRGLDLANGGETVTVVRNNTTVSTVRYGRAPEGEVYRRVPSNDRERPRWTWRPLGRTDRPVVRGGPAAVEAFVLPDAPDVPIRTIETAEERVLLAGYTLTSERVVDALVGAHERGVRVRVLVDGSPVGGATTRQAAALDRLVAAGVAVRAVGGPRARYRFHHAKYAVADDRALVLTENWKPAGVGGRSSRGWGVVVHDRPVARGLAATFRADWNWQDAIPWAEFSRGRSFEPSTARNGTFPTHVRPDRLRAEEVRLLVAPDNAETGVVGLIDGATDSLDVLQVSLGGPDGPFTRALVRAARRGVETRVLLSGAWYVREDNRALADRLNALAEREDLPLAVRLADPGGRFEKVHAKGLVVDGDETAVGSLNFNTHSARENREVVVVLSGESVAEYYGGSFERDWAGSDESLPLPAGLVAALGLAVLGALVLARRIEFADGA